MYGGSIQGCKAYMGGGVYIFIANPGSKKVGGTIYGKGAPINLRNVSTASYEKAGAAILVHDAGSRNVYRDFTVTESDNLSQYDPWGDNGLPMLSDGASI